MNHMTTVHVMKSLCDLSDEVRTALLCDRVSVLREIFVEFAVFTIVENEIHILVIVEIAAKKIKQVEEKQAIISVILTQRAC